MTSHTSTLLDQHPALRTAGRRLRAAARNANMPGARADATGLLDALRRAALDLLGALDTTADAAGRRMISVAAHELRSGDVVGLNGTWSTVGRVTLEDGEHASEVHVVLHDHGGDRMRSWRVVTGENVAILRRACPSTLTPGSGDDMNYPCAEPAGHKLPHHDAGHDYAWLEAGEYAEDPAPTATSNAAAAGWDGPR